MKLSNNMKYICFLTLTLVITLFVSCANDESFSQPIDAEPISSNIISTEPLDSNTIEIETEPTHPPVINNCNPVMKDFVPEIEDFEYYIEGEINGDLFRYPQVNYEWGNVSNKYFIDHEQTWLQAYYDSTNLAEYWKIRIHNVDIENITVPYNIGQSQGRVFWYDSRVDQIIENTDYCQGIDNGCIFYLSTTGANNTMTIENVSNQVIEGKFSGKSYLKRTGAIIGWDTTICYDITNGKFKIKYRVD